MDDATVLGRINELAREEHELFERESRDPRRAPVASARTGDQSSAS
jgi:hypothetical protein